jgi:antitoxin component YwqK of YwqJK toxin-antitoxin module
MKIIVIVFLFTMSLVLTGYVEADDVITTVIQNRNGISYMPNSDKPFTGKYVSSYGNGQKKSEENYKDGKQDGLATEWYKNGQKKIEINYKDGKEDGLATVWYGNGQKQGETTYKDGKPNGLATEWDKNGRKK